MENFDPTTPTNIYQFLANATQTMPSIITFTSGHTTVACHIPADSNGTVAEHALDTLTDALTVFNMEKHDNNSLTAYMKLHPTLSIDDAHNSYVASQLNGKKLFTEEYAGEYEGVSEGLNIQEFNLEEFLTSHREEILTHANELAKAHPELNSLLCDEGYKTITNFVHRLFLTQLDLDYMDNVLLTDITDFSEDIDTYAADNTDDDWSELDKWLITDDHTDDLQEVIDEGMLTSGMGFYNAVQIAQEDRMRHDLTEDLPLIQQAMTARLFAQNSGVYALSTDAQNTIRETVEHGEGLSGADLYKKVETALLDLYNSETQEDNPESVPVKTVDELKKALTQPAHNRVFLTVEDVRA